MPKISPVRAIAIIIFVYSISVIAGWIFNIDALVRVIPGTQPMAFVTAVSFLLSSISLWVIKDASEGKLEFPLVILPATTLVTLLLMTTIIAGAIFGVYTGIGELFLAGNALAPISPGMPAFLTVVGFTFFDAAVIHTLFIESNRLKKTIHYLEIAIILIGIIAVLGYITGIQVLTYRFTPESSPMAFNTAINFILLGIGIINADNNK